MAETFLFTSESVNEGHPDKLCDQVGSPVHVCPQVLDSVYQSLPYACVFHANHLIFSGGEVF